MEQTWACRIATGRTVDNGGGVMKVTTERYDHALLICVTGRVDSANIGEFETAIRSALEDGHRTLVMDLANMTYISSVGLRALLVAAQKLFAKDAQFALCSLPGIVQGKLEVVGFDKLIAIYPTRTEALTSVAA